MNEPQQQHSKSDHKNMMKEKIENIIKLLTYIGSMSYISLGYISRDQDLGLIYKLIAALFGVSTIASFWATWFIIANMTNDYTDREKRWTKKGMDTATRCFIAAVILVTLDAIF